MKILVSEILEPKFWNFLFEICIYTTFKLLISLVFPINMRIATFSGASDQEKAFYKPTWFTTLVYVTHGRVQVWVRCVPNILATFCTLLLLFRSFIFSYLFWRKRWLTKTLKSTFKLFLNFIYLFKVSLFVLSYIHDFTVNDFLTLNAIYDIIKVN